MAANDVQIQIIGKDLASAAFKSVNSAAAGTTAQMASLGRATSSLNSIFTSAAGFAAGIAGFQGLTAVIQGTIGAAYNFSKSMEVHETGMAGILLSMTEVNGRTLTWGESIALSKNIMSQLNSEALRTAATTEELTTAFRGILGPALNAKMTISEIIQLTSTGVNAIKSIMPANADMQRQLVQELRDLVAGGIQPASSTLATALGLKDKDIKAAKESSEGLFKFLMDRLKGFETSAPAYARTWQGIQDQIKEGITLAGSQGLDPVFTAMKEEMAAVAAQVVVFNQETGKMEVNPELVGTFREIGETAVSAGREIKAIASDIGVVAVPAAKVLGGAIKIAANNAEALTYAIGGWLVLRQVNVLLSDARAVAAGATQAQTFLGRAVMDTQVKYAQQAAAAAQAAAAERQAALAAAQAQVQNKLTGTSAQTAAVAAALGQKNVSAAIEQTIIAKSQESAAVARTAEVINAANAAARLGQYEVAQAILATNLSISEQSALAAIMAERMALAATAAKAGQYELAQSILAANIALSEQAVVGTVAGEKAALSTGAATIAQRELAASVALTTAAHIESGAAAAAAGATTIGAMAVAKTAVGNMITAVWALAGGWLGVAAATGYAMYKLSEYAQERRKINEAKDAESRALGSPPDNDVMLPSQVAATAQDDAARQEERRRRRLEIQTQTSNELILKNGTGINGMSLEDLKRDLSSKYSGLGEDGGGKGAGKAARAAERAYEEQERLKDRIADMIARMDDKINAETATLFETSTAKLTAETDNMKRELDKSKIDFEKYGIDVSGVYGKIGQYQDIMTAKIERQRKYALEHLKSETSIISAGISGDPVAEAEAEYQKEMTRIKKLREEDEAFKKIAKNKDDAEARAVAEANYSAQETAALKKRNDKYREAQIEKYDIAIEHNRLLIDIENKSAKAIDVMNKRISDQKISYLQTELQTAKLTQQERIKLERELADTISNLNNIKSSNMKDAVGIAINDIKNEQFNFADLYRDTWHDIDSAANEHFRSILNGNEKLGEGIKGTIKDITRSVTNMFADILYQTYIMQPIKNWFMGILGGIGGSSSPTLGTTSSSGFNFAPDFGIKPNLGIEFFADGGRAYGWSIVGEEGPELVNFSNPGRVYNAAETRQALSGGTGNAQISLAFNPTIQVTNASSEAILREIDAQWGVLRGKFINDLRNNSAVRSATKGAVSA